MFRAECQLGLGEERLLQICCIMPRVDHQCENMAILLGLCLTLWLMLLILLSLISVCVPLTTDLSCFLMFDHFLSLLFSLLLLLPSALTHRHTNTHIHCVHSQALKYFLSDTHSSASLHIFSLPFFFTHSWCWHAGFSTRTPFSYAHAPVVGRQKEQGREKVVKKQSASSQRERVRAGERGTK